MIYASRRERIAAEKLQLRGRRMRSMKVGVASFATFAGVTVAGVAPAHADHTVESGDTLHDIAAQNSGVTVSSLMEENGLSSHLIYPGQNLSFSGSSSASSSASTTSSSSGTHTVASGDTLGRIASQHGTSVSALMSENGLSSSWIYPGEQLTIPGASGSSSSTAAPSTSSSNSSSSSSPSSSSNSSTSSAAPAASNASGVIGIAKQYTGTPYVFGGASPSGFDCSGFTQYVFGKAGKSLPRVTTAQQAATTPVSNPQPGDLVFFGSPAYHVGIYVGNGMMIDAPRTGSSVSVRPVFSGVSGYGRV